MSGETNETTPWIHGGLVIAREVLDAVHADALREYPNESCGFLFGPASDPSLITRAQREQNEADRYHALDPERFPRTAKMYFKINELRASRALDAGKAAGEPLKVIYHSHCDAGAYFSGEDTATFSDQGVLTWPCAFLVTSVVAGELRETRLWIHVKGEDRFEESTFEIR